MAGQVLHIENPEAVQLANELARRSGKPVEQVVVDALRHEKERANPRHIHMDAVRAILARIDDTPVIDDSPPEQLLYDDRGLPK